MYYASIRQLPLAKSRNSRRPGRVTLDKDWVEPALPREGTSVGRYTDDLDAGVPPAAAVATRDTVSINS